MEKNFSRVLNNQEIQRTLNQLNSKGFVKIKNFLKNDKKNYFLNEITKIYSKNKKKHTIYNLQNLNLEYIKLVNNKFIKKILIKKLNDPYYQSIPQNKPNYNLKLLTARSSKNKLDLHIDTYFPFKGSNTYMLQIVILLEDSNLENGCTTVVEGSHLSGKYSNRNSKKIKLLEGKAGDVLIWDSRLWHGAKENKSNNSRWAIIATFGCWWIKPFMDITRSLPQKIYEKCNNEEKSILGFCTITPFDEKQGISTKSGYKVLKKNINEYTKKN